MTDVILSSETTLAYLAGFFDGEGCVYILRSRRGSRIHFGLEISFTNGDVEPLKLAKNIFGGQITGSHDGRSTCKAIHRLRIRSNQAAKALEQMLPYLRVKRYRAELGIEFHNKFRAVDGVSSRRLSIEECEQYKLAITSLNDKVWNRNRLIA